VITESNSSWDKLRNVYARNEHLTTYRNEVVGGVFPTTDYGFKIDDDEFDLFMNEVEKAS